MSEYLKKFFGFDTSTNNEFEYINICLVGCVSAGKSTILNAFFGQDYAQCKIKRTTMIANKFIETDDVGKIDSFDKITKTISDVNKQIYTQTENGKQLKLNDYGNELTFYVGGMEMNLGNRIKICIYDIPGLNDARTKNIYYEYLKNNFNKFNIILFVVDIHSGLNTSDEMDILIFLADNIKKHKNESKKNINMLTIVNKADDMQIEGNNLKVLGELGEMFDQTTKTVKQMFRNKNLEQYSLGCIPICGLDSHLYRMIKKFKNINKLTDENILRIGINDEGSKFKNLTKNEQRKKVENKINDNIFIDDMIKFSGFSQIENALITYIRLNGSSMIMENILWKYNQIEEMTVDNIADNIKQRVLLLSSLFIYDRVKYDTEMKNLVKKINTNVYRKISIITDPNLIKKFYDTNVLNPINQNQNIKTKISYYLDLNVYPNYFTDRILELVIAEYYDHGVPTSKLSYIELFENIGNFKTEIIDLVLDSLMTNPRGTGTFIFDNLGPQFNLQIIKLLDKVKISDKFIEFLRFFLANIYFTHSKPDELITKLMIFNRFEEIPLKQFINDLRIEKKNIDTNKQIKMYSKGLNNNYARENIIEMYYIVKCRDFNDYDNFLNHNKPITIDFSNII